MNKYRKGLKGEDKAAQFLKEKGYIILARNFRSRRGEIDIIAQKDDKLVFIEVKNWDTLQPENLEHSINKEKQKRIRETSQYFLYKHPYLQNRRMGFDVILIHGQHSILNHIENAFNGA